MVMREGEQGMKKVTVRMVGAAAGVSHATVSRVLNNDPRVHPSTRLAVIRAAQQLGYRLESGGGRKTIALILPNAVAGGYMGHMLMQIRAEISSRGYHTELVSPSDIGILNDRVISGGISLAIDNDQEAWEELKTLPLVKVNQTGNHLNRIYCVRSDGIQAMDLAVEYLAGRGHRRIAYLSDVAEERDRRLCSRRYDGFIAAMRRLGWSDPHRFMHFFAWHELPDFVALKKQGITAFVCAGEMTGVFVARGIHLQKLRIPEDFSLLGMEYVRISQALLPAQTTLVQNYSELAFHALELLEQLIRGETPAGDITVPYSLIERESVGSL